MPKIFHDPVDITSPYGAQTFNRDEIDDDGNIWHLDGLDGWDDGGDPEPEVARFGYSDGVVAARRFPLKERYVEVTGVLVNEDQDRGAAQRAWRKLQSIFDHNSDIIATRFGPIPEQMEVRLTTKIKKTKDLGHAFRWACTIMAEWPYKVDPNTQSIEAGVFSGGEYYREYDAADFTRSYDAVDFTRVYVADADSGASIGDKAVIVNEGNADGYPVTIVRGPLLAGSWELVSETTGESQTFQIDLSTGVELYIDHRRQIATINGQPVDYYIRGDWLRLIPGVNTIRLSTSEPNPDAGLTVLAPPATWR